MLIKNELDKIGLTAGNAVLIGSGILDALGIRKSKDIDVTVNEDTYRILSADGRFKKANNHGREVLVDGLYEIGTSWGVLGKNQQFNDLFKQSIVIDSVRYITLEFLLAVKRSWLTDTDVRQKDIDDIRLIEDYPQCRTGK